MSSAPHPLVCPQFFEIGRDTDVCLGESTGVTKVQLTEDGIFFLEDHILKCKRHQLKTIQLAKDVWDIDYDDNMLLTLQYDGSIIAWKGEVGSYVDIGEEEIETLSRKLFVLPELAALDIPHLICLRGDVGVVCVVSHSTLRLIKIESDLSISLSSSLDIRNKDYPNFSETVSDCKIWGTDMLFVAYTVLGNATTIYSIDPTNKATPCALCLVHHQEGWVTALSNGHFPVFASGDSAGGICFFTPGMVVRAKEEIKKAEEEEAGEEEKEEEGKEKEVEEKEETEEFVVSIQHLLTARPFTDSPLTVTALLMTEENILWIGTSDGVVYCSHFESKEEDSNASPSLVKLKKIRLHCAGWGACSILWEPYTDNTTGDSDWHRINGVLTSVCKDTGVIAQSEVFDFSDAVCNCCPMAIETLESVGHRQFVISCVCLSQLNLLVVVNEASEVTLWSLLTGVMVLELNTEVVKGKIINVASYEFLKTDKYLTNFILFLGLVDGTVFACFVSRYEAQLVYEIQQSTTVFSVLDLLGTLSKHLPSPNKAIPDDDSSLMGVQSVQDQDYDNVTANSSYLDRDGDMVEVPDSWEINFSQFAVNFKHPPLPVSDVFISALGQHVCVCYARCCLYVYAIDTGTLAFHVDLQYDQICDISKVAIVKDMEGCGDSYVGESVIFDQDSLMLSLLGKNVLKLFDALTGVIVTTVNLEEDPYASSIGDTFQYCGVWELTEAKEYANDFVSILVTNNGNVYAMGNITPLVLVYERSSLREVRNGHLDAVDYLPMNVEVFDIWSAFIVIIRFLRSTIVFKFDMRENFFSVIKSQTFTVENNRVSIVHVYPLEGDFQKSVPRVMVALSDGTMCSFNM